MSKIVIAVFLIINVSISAQSQDSVSQLIDSLTIVESGAERSEISNRIALALKDNDWERTLHYLEFSEREATASGSPEILARFWMTAADIYYDKDVLDVALEYYQKAYDYYSRTGDKNQLNKLENDLAIIYARLNNKDKALHHFKKVYEWQEKQDDPVSLVKILNNIGTLYLNQNPDSAETYYLKSLDIAKTLNNNKLNAYLYTNLGRVYFIKEKPEKATLYFDKAIALTNKKLDKDSKCLIYQLSSEYFLKSTQYDSAIHYANKAIELLNRDTINFTYQDIVRTLYKSYLAMGDYKNAAKYFDIYDVIRDSINVEEKAVNVERLKLEQEYKVKNHLRTLKENRKRFVYIIIGLSLVSGLLILLIILLRYKSRLSKIRLEKKLIEAKRKELNATLELKNNSLIAKAMTEIHRTEIIQGILEDLKEIKLKAAKKETQNAIDFISKRLGKEMNTNIWKEFEVSFEQVHETFFRNLNKKHPDLTAGDRRLCALLKLNLTSKEISRITGQSFKSVENARTRLRKKLGLTNTKTELVVYLNSLNT